MSDKPAFRQGDVLIREVAEIPANAKLDETERQRTVLAYGEVTGHAHAIREPVQAFKIETAEDAALATRAVEYDYILTGGAGAVLNHEYDDGRQAEHEPVSLLPNTAYQIAMQVEYTPEELRRVTD